MNLGDIVGGILKPVGSYFEKREERKALKDQHAAELLMKEHEVKLAMYNRQIELKSQGLEADANWEMEFARQAATSWKDEYVLIAMSIPVIMCFIPGCDVYVAKGFEALSKTPAWYQGAFLAIFLATYGIRVWRKTQYDTE